MRWNRVDWVNVIFSDESRFSLQGNDGRVCVWRRRGERFSQQCVKESDAHRGGSVCVWGAIGLHEKSDLVHFQRNVNADIYMNDVINDQVVPLFARRPIIIYMHDNAHPHTANATTTHLRNLGIPVMQWPAISPDLNPIEHIWDELERRMRARQIPPTNLPDLRVALTEEWQAIPQQRINKVINSMRKRCQAVINANGGHIRY